MAAAGLWDMKDIQSAERRIYKRVHCVPNDIKAQTLLNLVAHHSLTDNVLKRACVIRLDIKRQRVLKDYYHKKGGWPPDQIRREDRESTIREV